MSETTSKKRKLSLPLIVAGGVSSLVLALGMSPTFSAFTAQIINSANTTGSGTLVMWEVDGATTCKSSDTTIGAANSVTCASINKYGGSTTMLPGVPTVAKTITIWNKGSVAASTFSMNPGTCTPSAIGTPAGTAADLCTKMNVKITQGANPTPIYNGPAGAIASTYALGSLAPNTSSDFTFVVTLASGADNTYQGLQISQPITWNFQA